MQTTTRMMLLSPTVVTDGADEAVVDSDVDVAGAGDVNVEVADGGGYLV